MIETIEICQHTLNDVTQILT